MLSFEDARKKILQFIQPLASESIPLEAALNRVLAVDVVAQEDIPPFDNSSMDGFAVRAAEVKPGVPLPVHSEIPAGESRPDALQTGSAVRIFTGAPMPEGADAVVEIELVEERNGCMIPSQSIAAGRSIRRKGEDVKANERVMQRGERLSAAHLGLLASIGVPSIEVHRIPRVGIVTTGNELLPFTAPLTPGKIRNSNAITLSALVATNFCQPRNCGVAQDSEAEIRARIVEGLQCDALVTSGGVSVGKYDLVLTAAEAVGIRILFWKVNIKPGRPFAFGIFENRVPVFFLPGNAVSSSITFLQLAKPGIERLSGVSADLPVPLFAMLEHEIKKPDDKRHFSRGIVRSEGGVLFVRMTRSQSSGGLSMLTKANCLAVLPENVHDFNIGDRLEIQLL
jgi:molybdopterin molybdotransferase